MQKAQIESVIDAGNIRSTRYETAIFLCPTSCRRYAVSQDEAELASLLNLSVETNVRFRSYHDGAVCLWKAL
ncbi:MAG: hypothetical protein Q4A74_06920 [Cardiobacteriaceae bacterium]|nr:hypothetical protein [Cardiobacteriaceae bacterium]